MAPTATIHQLREQFLAAQLAGDRRGAVALVTTARKQRDIAAGEIRSHVIRAAQEEIGRLWERNEIDIAQEHMATAISQVALAELYRHEELPEPNGRLVVVACVEGELHDFPARLVADELDLAGFDVRFLGASVPRDALLAFIERERPDLLVLSATMAFHADSLRATVAAVRAAAPALPIAIGGQVCAWVETLGRELAADIAGCDAADLVRQAKRRLDLPV